MTAVPTARPGPRALGPAVQTALDVLTDRGPASMACDGQLEAMLRGALDAHRVGPDGAGAAAPAAVRTACAFLAAVDLETAYLALCTASDHLRGRITDLPAAAGSHSAAVSGAEQHVVRSSAPTAGVDHHRW